MKTLFTTLTLLLVVVFRGLCADYAANEGGVVVGAERLSEFRHLLEGRRVGVLANEKSRIAEGLLIDTLLASGVDVTLIFAPEGGFRNDGVERMRDSYMGIQVLTLTDLPKSNDVFRCDLIICDLQCSGVRSAAEVGALYRMMQVCATVDVPLLLLDRPNLNGGCVDGAIIEAPLRRGAEDLPLPLLYGMTLGELARMINGEGWLTGGIKCPLTVVPCEDYERGESGGESTVVPLSRGLCVEVPIVNERGEIDLSLLVAAYKKRNTTEEFFVGEEFDWQIGTSYVRDMIEMGYTAAEIESMWSADIERFCREREEYLIYE